MRKNRLMSITKENILNELDYAIGCSLIDKIFPKDFDLEEE